MTRRRRVLAAALSSVMIAPLLFLSGGTANAGAPVTCFGQQGTMIGTAGDDSIEGTSGDDVIIGLDGTDTINGNGGHDTICGGADGSGPDEGDTIAGEFGRDRIDGDEGDDFVSGDQGRDKIFGREGGDQLHGSEHLFGGGADVTDTVRGGSGSDTVTGGDGNDRLFGNRDRDNMFGHGGDDVINGGANEVGVGDEANFWLAPGPVVANLIENAATGEGEDRLVGIEGLGGSSHPDILVGNDTQNSFSGGLGPSDDDLFKGNAGLDSVSYTFAAQRVIVNLQGGTSFGDGSDTLESIEHVLGSGYDDTIFGSNQDNVLIGGQVSPFDPPGTTSNDAMYGRMGNDIMVGYDGDDQLFGGAGVSDYVTYQDAPFDPVNVNLSTGVATRSDGTDTIEGVEMIEGSNADDTLIGDNGVNLFLSEEGDDTIDGRGGSDLVFFLNALNGVQVNLRADRAEGMAPTVDVIENVEDVVGSEFGDDIMGDGGRNFLNGSDGEDNVFGSKGNDYLAGGAHNDNLVGGAGRNDLVDFFQSTNEVRVTLALNTQATGEGRDTLTSIESLSGSSKGDRFEGSPRRNTLFGAGGRDKLFGAAGDDQLEGGLGADSLNGGANDDRCFRKPESSGCESFRPAHEHPLTEVGRRYKKAIATARRYKRRYK